MNDEIWIELTDEMIAWIDKIADAETQRRFASGSRQTNGGPELNFEMMRDERRRGLRSELAFRRFLRLVERGDEIPWSVLSLLKGLPDFSDFINVKSRRLARFNMNIKPNEDPQRAYLCVCVEAHPRYRLVGWCWGHEARQLGLTSYGEAAGNPCFAVKEWDAIMKSPYELRDMALARLKVAA